MLAGSTESLGGWSVESAQPLRRTAEGAWASDLVLLPAGSLVAYKYVLITEGGSVVWQAGADNILAVRKTETALDVRDDWSSEEALCSVISWCREQPGPPQQAEAEEQALHHGGRAERRKERLQDLIEEMQRGLPVSSTAVAAAAGAAKGAVSAWPRARRPAAARSAAPAPAAQPPLAEVVKAEAPVGTPAAGGEKESRQPNSGATRRAQLLAQARPKKNRTRDAATAAAAAAGIAGAAAYWWPMGGYEMASEIAEVATEIASFL